jgi:D-beta-D-heptose 7-phosphate kinase / D-beta-D-heptose 1-phosphate adenosyltransferase
MIATREGLVELAKAWRANGLRIAFTNGCFRVLHVGHLATLAYAASQADRLIVGVDDDDAVRRLKGRQIVPAEQRALIVSVIRRVDAVVIFADGQLDALVAVIAPDILVKGEEYRGREIIGAAHAGRVAFTPMLPGVSTTHLLERIRDEQ